MTSTRNTPRKEAILRLLEHKFEKGYDYDPDGGDDFGFPPYIATTIATHIDEFGGKSGRPERVVSEGGWVNNEWAFWKAPPSEIQSMARTLRGMAAEGLVVQVRQKQQTHNAMGCVEMPQTCYYSARTYASDVARFGKAFPYESRNNVIEGDFIREVSPANDTTSSVIPMLART